MPDLSYPSRIADPVSRFLAPTLSDTVDQLFVTSCIFVTVAGNINFIPQLGPGLDANNKQIAPVATGPIPFPVGWHPIRSGRFLVTGTTATFYLCSP